jgi:hypothetical protein
VALFHEQLERLPGAEADRLARTLAGTDLLNATWSLARKARASGDVEALARAAAAARDALEEHRSRLGAIRRGEGTADVGGEGEGVTADPGSAFSKAGLDVMRKLESILRDLRQDR